MDSEQYRNRIWEILDPVDSEAFEAIAAEPPGDDAIQALAERTGAVLPDWLVSFCRSTNGLLVTAREEVWPVGKAFDIAPAWTFWRGLVLLGIEHETLPDWVSISQAQRWLWNQGIDDVLPVLRIEGDNGRLWGLRIRDGRVTGEVVEVIDGQTLPVEGDLLDLYETQVDDLVQRQQDMGALLAGARRGITP